MSAQTAFTFPVAISLCKHLGIADERRLSVVEELEAVVTTNFQRATRLRQAILQKAFTRKLSNQ